MLAKSFKAGRWAEFGKLEKGVIWSACHEILSSVVETKGPQIFHRYFIATSEFVFSLIMWRRSVGGRLGTNVRCSAPDIEKIDKGVIIKVV